MIQTRPRHIGTLEGYLAARQMCWLAYIQRVRASAALPLGALTATATALECVGGERAEGSKGQIVGEAHGSRSAYEILPTFSSVRPNV